MDEDADRVGCGLYEYIYHMSEHETQHANTNQQRDLREPWFKQGTVHNVILVNYLIVSGKSFCQSAMREKVAGYFCFLGCHSHKPSQNWTQTGC